MVHAFPLLSQHNVQQQQMNDQAAEALPVVQLSTNTEMSRRRYILDGIAIIASVTTTDILLPRSASAVVETDSSAQQQLVPQPPKFIQEYPDFTTSTEGWSYKVVTPGSTKLGDATAVLGDRVVFEWSGYTIGYYGRPFQAKGGPQGGAFDKELDYERTVIGSGKMVKGLECALVGTSPGQILQIVVPYDDQLLSYPEDDLEHVRVGPKPSTFSGQRALNFVLQNPRVDRTLLFNVKIVRIDKPNSSGGFSRG